MDQCGTVRFTTTVIRHFLSGHQRQVIQLNSNVLGAMSGVMSLIYASFFLAKDTYPERVERLRVMRVHYEQKGFSSLGETRKEELMEKFWLKRMLNVSSDSLRSQAVRSLYEDLGNGLIRISDILMVYSDYKVAWELEAERITLRR